MNNKNDIKRILILLILGVIAYLIISNLQFVISVLSKIISALFPFILGIVLAFVLNILMTKIENVLNKLNKKTKLNLPTRGIAIFISLIIFILSFTFLALELIPELINNLETLIKNIPTIFKSIENYIINLVKDYPEVQLQITEIFKDSTNWNSIIVNIINYIINGSIGFITSFVNSLITIFTALVFSIYMLNQKEYLLNGVRKIIRAYTNETKSKKILEIGKLFNQTFTKFVSGQCTEALILGVIFFTILTIFGFPYTLLISLISCITALIPIFGAFIAIIIGAILIATVNPYQSLIFIGIFLIVQQIEGNLIYPKVVGKSVGLSPIWTLLAITVGGSLFGVIGMLIGLPLASIVYAIIKKDVNTRLKTKKDKLEVGYE